MQGLTPLAYQVDRKSTQLHLELLHRLLRELGVELLYGPTAYVNSIILSRQQH